MAATRGVHARGGKGCRMGSASVPSICALLFIGESAGLPDLEERRGGWRSQAGRRASESSFFGPSWSPDGEWLMFQDCLFKNDPGHEASDICVARPDGSELKQPTSGGAMVQGDLWKPQSIAAAARICRRGRAMETFYSRAEGPARMSLGNTNRTVRTPITSTEIGSRNWRAVARRFAE